MFPCCSRVWCPCCSPYSRVDGNGDEDLELQEVSSSDSVDGVVTVDLSSSSDSEEEDITEESVETDGIANQGLFSPQSAACLASAGYSFLRICDYFQLFLLSQLRGQESLARIRRDLGSVRATTVPIYNSSNSSNHTDVPQWIYPCGITPNGTFPNGRRPFWISDPETSIYTHLERLNYSDYFRGSFIDLRRRYNLENDPLLEAHPSSDLHLMFPYGFTGLGDWILHHFGDFRPQYPYASVGISNELRDNGTCPHVLFNISHVFSGGYRGWEETGFPTINPCGIHPDGLFTAEWLPDFNGTIPPNSYPFGHFPNGTFPYVDYFFNPDFNHAALYLALQSNQTGVLSNFTRFADPTLTNSTYHPIPVNATEPFAHCYGIHPMPLAHPFISHHGNYSSYGQSSAEISAEIDGNIIRAGLWAAQFNMEIAMLVAHSCSSNPRHNRILQALYLGTRAANIIHSAVDLGSNLAHVWENGPTEGQGQLAIRNMLTLTDVLSFTNDAIYFCTPAIQRIQESVSQGLGASCFRRMCSSAQNVGRVIRNSMSKLTAIAGAVGVACTAGLGAALTADLINNDGQDNPEQRVILGLQIGVAAVAACALGWITRANTQHTNEQ